MIRFVFVASVACLSMTVPASAQIPDGYEVIQISDDADYDGPPAINNCGQVVYSKRINQGFDTEEIFLYDANTGETIRLTNDNVRDAYPDINDNGTIVWARGVGAEGTLEIALYQGGELAILTDSPYGLYCTGPQVNKWDHVAWQCFNGTGCSGADIFFYDGETTTQITSNGFSNQVARINDHDDVVWTQFDLCAQPWWIGEVMLHSGGITYQLTDDGMQLGGPDINDAGIVAWTNGNLIEVLENGVRSPLAEPAGGPRFNELGDIAYNCWQTNTDTWQACFYKGDQFFQLTDDPMDWNAAPRPNDVGEVAWHGGTYPNLDVYLMRMESANGDVDANGTVDLLDFNSLAQCLGGPVAQACLGICRPVDFDEDRDVDLLDFASFELQFTRTDP